MRKTTYAVLRLVAMAMLCGGMAMPMMAFAQDKAYTEGTVWTVSMIRVKPGMLDVYMREVLPLRKKINEEAKKQGLVISSHVWTNTRTGLPSTASRRSMTPSGPRSLVRRKNRCS